MPHDEDRTEHMRRIYKACKQKLLEWTRTDVIDLTIQQ